MILNIIIQINFIKQIMYKSEIYFYINVGLWKLAFDGLYINNQINRQINNDNFRPFNNQIMVIIWWRKCIWIYIIHIKKNWIWKCFKRLLKQHVASNTTLFQNFIHFTFLFHYLCCYDVFTSNCFHHIDFFISCNDFGRENWY
jgi:hypothetical protein